MIVIVVRVELVGFFFFFNDTATTEIYTLSLHDALPISADGIGRKGCFTAANLELRAAGLASRSEEHTSELQSQSNLVCRLLLEKKKKKLRKQLVRSRTSQPPIRASARCAGDVATHAHAR